jgi:hypothetical protein
VTNLAVIVCVAFDHRASGEGLARFKACISHCPFVDTTMEVSGTYDLIVQGHCASHAEYAAHMELIRPQVAQFATRIETNFVSSKIDQRNEDEGGALWLPCDGGRRQVEAQLIDKILAEGDYMRVHVGSWNCLIHHTMRRLCEQLPRSSFIKLHRSSLVRIGFIDRLVHDERHWKARLRDGTHVSIAKSQVQQVLRLMSGESSKIEGNSTKENRLPEMT